MLICARWEGDALDDLLEEFDEAIEVAESGPDRDDFDERVGTLVERGADFDIDGLRLVGPGN